MPKRGTKISGSSSSGTKNLSEKDYRDMMRCAYLFHQTELDQNTIATQLDLSPSKVSRLLRESRKYLSVNWNLPSIPELEIELVRKFGLMDARVVFAGDTDLETVVTGHKAAQYFREKVKDGNSVATSCGHTLLEMILALPSMENRTLSIYQVTVEGDPEFIHQSSSTIAGLLRAKCGSQSSITGLQLPPDSVIQSIPGFMHAFENCTEIKKLREEAITADFVFFGIGPTEGYRMHRKHSALERVHKLLGDSKWVKLVREYNIVGEALNQFYSEDGTDRTSDLPKLSKTFVKILSLKDLKSMAEQRHKHKVVAVATGVKKAEAIRIALVAGYANILITSADTAVEILKDK